MNRHDVHLVNYLSKVSPEWKTRIGEGTAIAWLVGIGRKGNEGVAEYVQKTQGAIGWQAGLALTNKAPTILNN